MVGSGDKVELSPPTSQLVKVIIIETINLRGKQPFISEYWIIVYPVCVEFGIVEFTGQENKCKMERRQFDVVIRHFSSSRVFIANVEEF